MRNPGDDADARESDPSYAVGYRRPPVHSRFKKGQSGNPKGRSKGAANVKTLLNQALDEPIEIAESGRRRKVRRR
ncbi:MAG: DUF5681 domain-containing protein [Parvularculaceae bacterium]